MSAEFKKESLLFSGAAATGKSLKINCLIRDAKLLGIGVVAVGNNIVEENIADVGLHDIVVSPDVRTIESLTEILQTFIPGENCRQLFIGTNLGGMQLSQVQDLIDMRKIQLVFPSNDFNYDRDFLMSHAEATQLANDWVNSWM